MKSATLKDVAREALVSIASASRAINGLDNVADDVRARVLKAADKLKYIPHGGARSLATSRTNTIGVLLPDIYGEFFSEIIRGIDVAARARGLHILVSGSHGDFREAVDMMRAMAGRVDGLLVMSPFVDANDISDLLPNGLPIVMISSSLGENNKSAISIDNYGGGIRATRHLVEMGCRKIAHIRGPSDNFEANERERGFLSVVKEKAGAIDARVIHGDFTELSGEAAIEQFINSDFMPDGIFAANDMMAIGCIIALKEKGIKVPEQVKIIGFDDIPIARLSSPSLSTIRVGVFDIGRRGLEYLVDNREGENRNSGIVILPELVVRQSTAGKKAFVSSKSF